MLSHLIERFLHLDPPLTRDLAVRRDLRVPMPDGAVLLADLWAPRISTASLPVALLRSPYGRRGLIGSGLARPLAERGFQVLIQSTRGTFGSGGLFDPMRQEREDGLATLDWVVKQPWFDGSIVLIGASYLGYVQWAVADRLPPEVKAMIPQATDSALTLEFLRPDGLSLETPFAWGVMVAGQERRGALLALPSASTSWGRKPGATSTPGRRPATCPSASTSSPAAAWTARLPAARPCLPGTATTQPTRPRRSAACA